jgi:hypothetical protein
MTLDRRPSIRPFLNREDKLAGELRARAHVQTSRYHY